MLICAIETIRKFVQQLENNKYNEKEINNSIKNSINKLCEEYSENENF